MRQRWHAWLTQHKKKLVILDAGPGWMSWLQFARWRIFLWAVPPRAGGSRWNHGIKMANVNYKENTLYNSGVRELKCGPHDHNEHSCSNDNSLQVVELSGPQTCKHILPNRFLDGFPDPSQFAAAKLTHYSSKPQRPSDSSRAWQRILLSGDVHPNPGPTTKYPCPVCARNVTSRGVSYLCNRCSGWVHSKCSDLQNAAEYRRIKDWVCSSCNSPPTLPKLQPPPIPTQAVEYIHHHAIQRKWHRQQTDGIRWILKAT